MITSTIPLHFKDIYIAIQEVLPVSFEVNEKHDTLSEATFHLDTLKGLIRTRLRKKPLKGSLTGFEVYCL